MIKFWFRKQASSSANSQTQVDTEPSEETPLTGQDDFQSSRREEEEAIGPSSSLLWNELEQPWPSTFERSIALLASPKLSKAEADLFTRSPHPGATPAALFIRENMRRKRNETPEAPVHWRYMLRDGLSSSERQTDILGDGSKHRLDFDAVSNQLATILTENEQKLQKARNYRQNLLGKPDNTETKRQKFDDGTKSPGFRREQTALRAGKKRMEQQAEAIILDSKSSFIQCIFNLANILMGVGLLGLPSAISRAGWCGGIACLLLVGAVAWRTSILIGRSLNGDHRPIQFFDEQYNKLRLKPGSTPEARALPELHSFPAIARAAFGETGCLLLSATLYFELFSCICIFFVSIGDHLHLLFPSVPTSTHVLVVGCVSMLPTIVLRTPALLSYLSMVGTVATVAVCVSVVVSAVVKGDAPVDVNSKPRHQLWDPSGVVVALGLVAYCFSGHAIVPSIYTSMRHPRDFEVMCTVTFSIVMLCCLAVGTAGYYMYGMAVLDQITLSLQQDSQASEAMNVLTWLMVMTAFSKITLTMFPLALGIEELVTPYLTSQFWVDVCSSIIKLLLTASAIFVAICIPSFSMLCALVGLICTMVVSVIFPPAAFLRLFWSKLSWMEKAINVLFVALGLVVAIVGSIKTLA